MEQLHLFKCMDDADVVREPALYLATKGGCAIFVPNNLTMIQRLRALSLITSFEVVCHEDVLMLRQGEWPGKKIPDDFMPKFRIARHAIMAGGWDENGVVEQCLRCEYVGECKGPLTTAPKMLFDKRDDGGMGLMGDSIIESLNSRCPLFHSGIRVEAKELTPADLRRHGFEPIASVRAFTDDDVGADDIDALRTGQQSEAWKSGVVSEGWRMREDKWSRKPEASAFSDLFFDERVAVNVMKQKARGAHAKACKDNIKAYRAENCERCVYECKQPPWNLEKPGPLTHEQIMDEYKPTKRDRRWMRLFMATRHTGQFVNPETGYMKYGIGCRPTDELKMRVLALVPPYGLIEEMEPEAYWRCCEHVGHHEFVLPEWDMDETKMTYAHWALRSIVDHTKWDETRFKIPAERREYQMARNDVLAIEIWGHGNIRIHSDTKASTNGMGWGTRGKHIAKEDRPRFATDYLYPYTDSFASWFNTTPGACCGRKIE